MFRNKIAKIVSAPAEEILEVIAPVEPEEPELQQVTNIEFLAVQGEEGESSFGSLQDYDGNYYYYEWDLKSKRIVRLLGDKVDYLTWHLCNEVLRKYYIKPDAPKQEEIGPQVEQAVNKALASVTNSFKNLEGKLDKALTAKSTPAPAPVQAQPVQRPAVIQSTPMDTPAINVADDDISVNALRFLQESGSDDPSIDFMSL